MNVAPGLRHFLCLSDCSARELRGIIARAVELKTSWRRGERAPTLAGRVVIILFEHPSTRTRVALEAGIAQLGGSAVFLSPGDTQLRRGEPIEDTARALSSMADAVALRTARHETQVRFAEAASAPVINALSDRAHPCQLLADVMTFEEHRGSIQGKRIAWLGDGNNVCRSWIEAAGHFDFSLRMACPPGRAPEPSVIEAAGGRATLSDDPKEAAAGAHLLVTDVWSSMNQEGGSGSDTDQDGQRAARAERFGAYQLNEALRALAEPDALCMHCLPAHRGEEISAALFDAPDSVIWEEAENRLHTHKALFEFLLRR